MLYIKCKKCGFTLMSHTLAYARKVNSGEVHSNSLDDMVRHEHHCWHCKSPDEKYKCNNMECDTNIDQGIHQKELKAHDKTNCEFCVELRRN